MVMSSIIRSIVRNIIIMIIKIITVITKTIIVVIMIIVIVTIIARVIVTILIMMIIIGRRRKWGRRRGRRWKKSKHRKKRKKKRRKKRKMRGRRGIGKTRTSFVFPLCVSVRISSEALVRNQHQFDVLKAVDTSKKDIQLGVSKHIEILQVFEHPLNANGLEDLAAKRWMSCLVVSNGFRFQADLSIVDRLGFEGAKKLCQTLSFLVNPSHPYPGVNCAANGGGAVLCVR